MDGKSVSVAVAAAAAGVAAAAGFLLGRRGARPALNPPKAFVLAIRLKLKPGAMPLFLQRWTELANHCKANEPHTLTVRGAKSLHSI